MEGAGPRTRSIWKGSEGPSNKYSSTKTLALMAKSWKMVYKTRWHFYNQKVRPPTRLSLGDMYLTATEMAVKQNSTEQIN